MIQLNLIIAIFLTAASCNAAPASSADLEPVNQEGADNSKDDSTTREKKSYPAPCIEVHGPSHATYSICNSASSVPISPPHAAAQFGGVPTHFVAPPVSTYFATPQYNGHASIAMPTAQIVTPGFNVGFNSNPLPSSQSYGGGRPIYPVNQGPIYRSDEAATPSGISEFTPNDLVTWQQFRAQLPGAGVVQTEAMNARSVYGGANAGPGGAIGVFPTHLQSGGGCGAAIPLLISCTPNIVQGNFPNTGSTHGYGGWNNVVSGAHESHLGANAQGYQVQLGSPNGYRQNQFGEGSSTVAGALNDKKGALSTSIQESHADKISSNNNEKTGH